MYTSRSHVLNFELYKVLVMKIDELCSTVGRDDDADADADALCLENKDLWEQLAFYEDVRAHAIFDITKAKMIQRACVQAQKKRNLGAKEVRKSGDIIYDRQKKKELYGLENL
ncbi:hypothetical protein Fot_56383 [Forsythia ovata]|uniref:Uncharacterized protein n=1 Tax=Forsythia ovata TaxID=205694 RepID=A0ABD1P3H1_9LAMI